jgi:uncharacterized membrane protein YqaE (UPF0057 family)
MYEVVRYLLAIILPPVAVLLCGKPVQALLNLVLTLFFWIPGVVHAHSPRVRWIEYVPDTSLGWHFFYD